MRDCWRKISAGQVLDQTAKDGTSPCDMLVSMGEVSVQQLLSAAELLRKLFLRNQNRQRSLQDRLLVKNPVCTHPDIQDLSVTAHSLEK